MGSILYIKYASYRPHNTFSVKIDWIDDCYKKEPVL